MITLTHEEAQQVLNALEGSIDAQQWEIDDHITKYGEWYRPQRVEYMKQQLANTNSAIETLRAKLSEPEPEPVAYINVQERKLEWAAPTRWETSTVVFFDKVPLYTAPPQRKECLRCGEVNPAEIHTCTPRREWQGLTDEEMTELYVEHKSIVASHSVEEFAKSIEAKLKEKNSG